MRTEQQIRDRWNQAKQNQFSDGYATQYDRRTARLIRQRQRHGEAVTEKQITFAEQVERTTR